MLSQIKDSYNILSALLLSDNSTNVSTVHIDYTLKFYANNYYSHKAKRASAHGNFPTDGRSNSALQRQGYVCETVVRATDIKAENVCF